jgi:hypothetical protein
MIVLEGAPALSPFRRDRLQARLNAIAPALRIVDSRHGYWIDPEPGSSPDGEALKRILQADEGFAASEAGATSRFIVPRLGTLSPWAGKATELLHGAGLRAPKNRVPTYEALGQCFMEKEQLGMAATILGRAEHEKGVSDDQLVGVLYLLGRCAEARGQRERAADYYQRVFVVDIQFHDVGERMNALENATR